MPVAFATLALACVGAPAQAAPKADLKEAYAVDRDGDGHVDGARVSWSKGSTPRADSAAPFELKIGGYKTTKVHSATKGEQLVEVAEKKACDVGAAITVKWGRKRLDMRRLDTAAPRITCAVTRDADGDSRVDGLRLSYSRKVRNRAQRSGPFLFSVDGYDVKRVHKARGRFLVITVAEGTKPDSGAKPAISYREADSRKSRRHIVRAGRSGAAYPGTFQSTRDGVSPQLLGAATGDSDRDGLLDTMVVVFSEPVSADKPGALAVLGMKVRRAASGAGSTLVLTLGENTARGDARPGTWIAGPGVHDSDGNPALRGAVTPIDRAAPVLVAAATVDTGGLAGYIDGVRVFFSEPVLHARDTGGTYPFTVDARKIMAVEQAAGYEIHVRTAEGRVPDSGTRVQVSHVPGRGRPVTDVAGNQALAGSTAVGNGAPGVPTSPPTGGGGGGGGGGGAGGGGDTGGGDTGGGGGDAGGGGGGTPAVDEVAPALVSATTGDADEDGFVDRMTLRFSEDVVHPAEAVPTSFTVTGYTVSSAGAASGRNVTLVLAEEATPDTGARPTVNYTPDGVDDIRDAAGNFTAASTIAQSTDGAPPVLISSETSDADDDGRLDGLATVWSEPLDHADDVTAPFSIAVSGFTVSRVAAAAGTSLPIELQEPSGLDTGSAPAITYNGGSGPVRDSAGVEAAQRTYSGLTRDVLPPRLGSIGTVDSDTDGRIDAVDFIWSESVTGSTGLGPFTVTGRTLSSVSLSGSTTRVRFAEIGAGYDTDATLDVAYDAVTGDLHDVAEGPGDTTADTPSVGPATAADTAGPAVVAAKTADLSTPGGGNTPNGTIDAVHVTFSEPITHSVDGAAPFSLKVAARTETQVEGDDGTANDRTLYVTVAEHSSPDGGYKPNVTVNTSGPSADLVKDRATTPNNAPAMTFSGTTDEVRPVIVSAQLGEQVGGTCTADALAGIDGQVDCAITTWSESVRHAADNDGTYSIVPSGWTVDGAGIGQLGPSETLEIPLTPAASPDRDRNDTTVSYASASEPVVDDASPANEALDGTEDAAAACRDTGLEGNDTQDTGTAAFDLATTSPAFQRKCAFDDDWYRLATTPEGYIELLARPARGVDVQLELVDSNGDVVAADTEVVGGAGETDRLTYTGLGDSNYWARVTASDNPNPQEGAYCVVYSSSAADQAGCGPLAGQLVFTEVGFGDQKFIEVKNDAEVPVEMLGAGATLVVGSGPTSRQCVLALPTDPARSEVDPGDRIIIEQSASATDFGCSQISSLSPDGERLELTANGAIDVANFQGITRSSVSDAHSLQYIEDELSVDHVANDNIRTNWCRTFTANTKGTEGDGCDEYRINEVLWKPAATDAASQGRAFVEIAGNLPALPNSELLGGWILRGVNGLTGDGTADFVLDAAASPDTNGTYVVADGQAGVTQVAGADEIWESLDTASANWPDSTGVAGPRGIQLLLPDADSTPPCTASADAFGWTSTAQGFTQPLDDMRSCAAVEGQEYTNSTIGASAARDNLSSSGDATYNESFDSNQNRGDFCPQVTPSPGALNIRPSC